MVKYSSAALDTVFSALSDPTRRAVLRRLMGGSVTVTELARPFDMSLPAISRHLRVLEQAGLLRREKAGRMRHCRLTAGPIREAAMWIADYSRFWEERLDALEAYLEAPGTPPHRATVKKEDEPWEAQGSTSKRASRSSGPSRPPARKSSRRSRNPKR